MHSHALLGYPNTKFQYGSCIRERRISLSSFHFNFIYQDLLAAFGIRQNNKFSKEQRSILQEFYETVKYPTAEQRKELSEKLSTTENQVYWWFTKTRQRDKKNSLNK